MEMTQTDLRFAVRVDRSLSIARFVDNSLQEYLARGVDEQAREMAEFGESEEYLAEWIERRESGHSAALETVRMAHVLSAWAGFEYAFERYAETCFSPKSSLRPRDLRGRGIERSRSFLEKLYGVEIDLREGRWQELVALRDLRNQLAHSHLLPGPNSTKTAVILRIPGVELDEDGFLGFKEELWYHMHDVLNAFVSAAIEAVHDRGAGGEGVTAADGEGSEG